MKYFPLMILVAILLIVFLTTGSKEATSQPSIPDLRSIRIQSRTDYIFDIKHDLEAVDLSWLDYELNQN